MVILMLKDITKINLIETITARPLVDKFMYIVKLKKGYVFNLTNSNQIECDTIDSIDTVLTFGIKWLGYKKEQGN